MALTDRAAEAIGGPGGQTTTWYDDGPQFTLQNHAGIALTTSLNELPVGIVPYPNKIIPGGLANPDAIPAGQAIQDIFGGQIALAAVFAALATLTLAVGIRRNNVLVGGQYALGWLGTASGGANVGTPSFAAMTTTPLPWIVNAAGVPLCTAVLPPSAAGQSNFYLPVQPGDIIVAALKLDSGVGGPIPVATINLTQV